MGQYQVEAVFNAVDNITAVAATIADRIAGVADFVGESMSGIGDDFEETGDAIQALAGGPLSTLEFGLKTFVGHIADVDQAMDTMTARLGRSDEDMARLKTRAEELFKTGMVDSFQKAADAVEAMSIHMDAMSKEDFSELTRRVLGVSEAFGDSPKGVARSVDTLIRRFNDLRGDPFKALDLMVTTAQNASRPLSEIEGVIERYSGKFAAAGLTALGMGGLIVRAAQAGIGPSGMGALSNAIDTFHDRVAKPPWAFTNALRKLGLGDVLTELKANKISMDEALNKVFEAFNKLPEGPQKTQLALSLFGGSIDKIGGAETLGKLAGFRDALGGPNGIKGAADKVADMMQDTGSLGQALKSFWNTAKTNFEQGADQVFNILKNTKWDEVLNGIMNNIKTNIENRWNETKKVIEGAINSVKKTIEDGFNTVLKFVNGVVADVGATFNKIGEAITAALKPASDFLQGIIDKIAAIAGKIGASAIGNPTMEDISHPGRAMGGPLDEGFTWVGEEGPELAFKRGGNVDIFSNRESRSMMGSTASAGSSGATVNMNGTYYIVGAGGIQEFIRMVRVGLEGEDVRLGRLS